MKADHQKLLAVYAYMDDVLHAIGLLKEKKTSVETVYSPAPNVRLESALGIRPSGVRRIILGGALFGIAFGTFLAIYTATRWNLVVWGKHPISLVPYVVIAFEFCVLFAVLSGVAGFLILSRLPRFRVPRHFDARFTVDRYGLLLSCPAARREEIAGLLRKAGAEEVRDVDL